MLPKFKVEMIDKMKMTALLNRLVVLKEKQTL